MTSANQSFMNETAPPVAKTGISRSIGRIRLCPSLSSRQRVEFYSRWNAFNVFRPRRAIRSSRALACPVDPSVKTSLRRSAAEESVRYSRLAQVKLRHQPLESIIKPGAGTLPLHRRHSREISRTRPARSRPARRSGHRTVASPILSLPGCSASGCFRHAVPARPST